MVVCKARKACSTAFITGKRFLVAAMVALSRVRPGHGVDPSGIKLACSPLLLVFASPPVQAMAMHPRETAPE